MCEMSCEHACFVGWVTRLVRAERPHLVAAARAEGLADADALDAVQDGLITFLGLPAAAAIVDRASATLRVAARPGEAGAFDRDREGARLLATVVRNAARNARRRH